MHNSSKPSWPFGPLVLDIFIGDKTRGSLNVLGVVHIFLDVETVVVQTLLDSRPKARQIRSGRPFSDHDVELLNCQVCLTSVRIKNEVTCLLDLGCFPITRSQPDRRCGSQTIVLVVGVAGGGGAGGGGGGAGGGGGVVGGQSLQDGFEWFQDRNLWGVTAFRPFRDQAAITWQDLPFDRYDAMQPVNMAHSRSGDCRALSREECCEHDDRNNFGAQRPPPVAGEFVLLGWLEQAAHEWDLIVACHNLMKLHVMRTKALLSAPTARIPRPATQRTRQNRLVCSPCVIQRWSGSPGPILDRRKDDPTVKPAVIAVSKIQPAPAVLARTMSDQRGTGVSDPSS